MNILLLDIEDKALLLGLGQNFCSPQQMSSSLK